MKLSLIINSFRNTIRLALGGVIALTLASCGGGGGSAGTVPGVTPTASAGSVSLIVSNPELQSAGAAGTEVTVTALVKTADNNAMAGVPVKFTADSGALTIVDTVSDKNGQAKALLGTSGDRTNRKITLTTQAGGQTASGTVSVVGTSVASVGPASIAAGSTGDFTISVKDSANAAVANVPISFASQKGNPVTVKSSGGGTATAPLTNSRGQVVLTLSGAQSGNDTLSFSAQGSSTASTINVNASVLTVKIVDASGNPVTVTNTTTSCQRIAAHYEVSGVPQTGTVNISTSRGRIYSDSACLTLLVSSSVSLTAGDSQPTYVKSDTAGIATVTAAVVGGPSAQTNLEFVAALTASATISLQADPAVIGTNSGTGQSEQSTLTAVVRDGTANNNYVKNAVVEFSIVNDKSGGALSNPSVVTTASNGSATVTFIAGTADTPTNGVTIQAKIQGTSTTATANLTVTKKSLFITAGTGNILQAQTDTEYKKDFAVFVSDASGNPVSGVTITASMIPTRYRKGTYVIATLPATGWAQSIIDTCGNEDANQNGILDAGEDFNNNGVLDPRIPLTVTSTGTTDATGAATISILYPKDRGGWTEVKLTVRGSVTGTESIYTTTPFFLPVAGPDLTNTTSAPPGTPSPYGVNTCNLTN